MHQFMPIAGRVGQGPARGLARGLGQTRGLGQSCSGRRGFTLIEVLVVIAVIAGLISLLLPALKGARETGRTVKCLANTNQIVRAAISYAVDYKDQIWPVADRPGGPRSARVFPPINPEDPDARNVAQWAQLYRDSQYRPGFLYQYVENAHFITECPTNKRRTTSNKERVNMWAGTSGVDFDYTMLDEMEGIRLGAEVAVAWTRYNAFLSRVLSTSEVPTLTRMPGVPLFFEENTRLYNEEFRDAMFGNDDQITTRHGRGSHVGYLDGSASMFQPPRGPRENVLDVGSDFLCKFLYISKRQTATSWFAVSDQDWRFGTVQRYGWANDPN